ncbi:MAG: ribbon-helix-helix domain-containing protein [Solirubrobacteraceae bacterium]
MSSSATEFDSRSNRPPGNPVKTIAGDELSEQDIEVLADEAERGYDLSKALRRHVGRPALGDAGVSPRVQVRVDAELATALRVRARREKRSVSEIARSALREYLERVA